MIITVELIARAVKRVHVEVPDDFFDSMPRKSIHNRASKTFDNYPPLNELMGDICSMDMDGGEMNYEITDNEASRFIEVCPKSACYRTIFPDYCLTSEGQLYDARQDGALVNLICDQLWPDGDKDYEWNSETVENIANLLINAGFGPARG